MSLLEAASFGYTNSVSVWGNGPNNGGTAYTISTNIVRPGGSHTRSYRAAASSSTWRYRNLPTGQTFLVFGFAFYIESTGPSAARTAIIEVTDQVNTPIFRLYLSATNPNVLTAQINGVDAGSVGVDTLTWYTCLFQVALDSSARIRASINGVDFCDVTQNTSGLGTSFGDVGLGIALDAFAGIANKSRKLPHIIGHARPLGPAITVEHPL